MSPAELLLWPEALPLLLFAPLAWLVLFLRDRARAHRLEQRVGPRAAALASERSGRRRAARRLFFALGLFCGLVAALGPVFGGTAPDLTWRGIDVVVCLDVSRSMLAGDLEPNRLARAKQEIRALAERAQGDRLALVVFAGEARRVVPLTGDRITFANLADLADPYAVRRGGTNLGAALDAALVLLEGHTGEHGAVVLLTDGEDLEGRALGTARRLAARSLSVHCVGFGTERGGKIALAVDGGEAFLRDRAGREVVSSLDPTTLKEIASVTGGGYVDASTTEQPLVELYEERILPMARTTFGAKGQRKRETHYQGFLLAAFLLWFLSVATTDRSRR